MTFNTHGLLIAAILTTSSHAATVLNLTGDVANSDAGAFGTNFLDTLSDPFAYNPRTPTNPLPAQGSGSSVAGGWHGNKSSGTHILSYTLTGGAMTTTVNTDIIHFDLYGRDGGGNLAILLRDNNYTVTLFNGNYSTQVAQLTGQGVPDAAPFFNRSTFNLGTGVTFDRIRITAPAGSGEPNQFFTVMEVRAATVPEPSSALMSVIACLGIALRRKR